MAEAVVTTEGLLRRIAPDDKEAHLALAKRLATQPIWWSDEVLVAPVLWYIATFCNPLSLVFDVADGGGMIAITHVDPKWRARLYLSAWHSRAMRRHDVWRLAAQIGFLTHDLLVMDAFIVEGNTLSKRAAETCGMHLRGTIKGGLCYNGVPKDILWYEATRRDAGLED